MINKSIHWFSLTLKSSCAYVVGLHMRQPYPLQIFNNSTYTLFFRQSKSFRAWGVHVPLVKRVVRSLDYQRQAATQGSSAGRHREVPVRGADEQTGRHTRGEGRGVVALFAVP